jgi:hypothetical protein
MYIVSHSLNNFKRRNNIEQTRTNEPSNNDTKKKLNEITLLLLLRRYERLSRRLRGISRGKEVEIRLLAVDMAKGENRKPKRINVSLCSFYSHSRFLEYFIECTVDLLSLRLEAFLRNLMSPATSGKEIHVFTCDYYLTTQHSKPLKDSTRIQTEARFSLTLPSTLFPPTLFHLRCSHLSPRYPHLSHPRPSRSSRIGRRLSPTSERQ